MGTILAAKVSDDWYKTFFNDLAADFWDGAITEEWTVQEINFLHQVFSEKAPIPGRLLDVFCGAGRHIPGLSTLGYQVIGVDISEKMLEFARLRCEAESPGFQGQLIQMDASLDIASGLSSSSMFDGAYCLGNSFGYSDAESTKTFLAGIVSLLKPGAKLVLNSAMLAETLMPNWETRLDMVAGGVHAKIENLEYDPVKSCLITRFEFEAESDNVGSDDVSSTHLQETHLIRHYIFTSGEVIRWLEKLGCQCLGIYCGLDKRPYRLGDEQWYGVFHKH